MDTISILLFQLVIGKNYVERICYIWDTQEIMGKLTKYCREKALQSGLSRRDATSIQSLVRKGAFHCINNKAYICAKRLKIELSSLLSCVILCKCSNKVYIFNFRPHVWLNLFSEESIICSTFLYLCIIGIDF